MDYITATRQLTQLRPLGLGPRVMCPCLVKITGSIDTLAGYALCTNIKLIIGLHSCNSINKIILL